MGDEIKTLFEVPAILDHAITTVEVEYRGHERDDSFYYLYRLKHEEEHIFRGFVRLTWEAGLAFKDEDKPPHQWIMFPGWTVLAYALRRSLRTMFRNKQHWKEWDGDFTKVPKEVQQQCTITSKTEHEARLIDVRRREQVIGKIIQLIRDLDFAGYHPTPLGIYLSTQLTVVEIDLAIRHLQSRGVIAWNVAALTETTHLIVKPEALDSYEPKKAPLANDFMPTSLPYEEKDLAFVMMPFKADYWKWLDGNGEGKSIRELVAEWSERKCVTVADDHTGFRIEDKIYTHIQHSTFCFANISEPNASVFYELGIAHTLGKPVILMCDEMAYQGYMGQMADEKDLFGQFLKSVFDVSHRTILRFKNRDELLPRLEEAVEQTLRILGER